MSFLESAGIFLLIITFLVGLLATLLGLPGQFLILAAALVYAAATGFATLGWKVLLILVFLAALAEALDFGLRAVGAARFGASRKGAWAAILGSIAGMFLFTPFLFGLGTVLGAFAGGFAGVFAVEMMQQRKIRPALRAGLGSILGGMAVILAKGGAALVMIVVTLINIYS
ncbi:MAG TPA: DUF456 domain-containing protein [Syntrophales bacterium]|nr:DUF456 domain-containing protein [Syntrophales bacterium]